MVGLQAYRGLAKRLHPDKAVKQGVTKREAEKRFHDLAEAYEVGYPSPFFLDFLRHLTFLILH